MFTGQPSAAALGTALLERVGAACAAVGAHVARALAAERNRWPLWLPVGMGAGIALYFVLYTEPSVVPGYCGLAVAAVLSITGLQQARRSGRGQGVLIAGLALGSVALGFTVAKLHSDSVAAPVLDDRLGPVWVTGRVVSVEPAARGPRVVLDSLMIGHLGHGRTPERVRIRFRPRSTATEGARLRVLAILMPPPEPAAPGAFDFARNAWFMGLGAVGFALSAAETIAPPAPRGLWDAVERRIAGVRRSLYLHITATVPGPSGAIVAALMTGERGDVPEETLTDFRVSGLAHLLSISGLHVGLVTGVVFFAVRFLLALWPAVALRYPIKKWAAAVALLGGVGYMLLSGASVPTQRSVIMAGLVLLAVIIDRSALSMRLVAWAAVVVLLISPESLTGPSFQMSFAAVAALIAAYESARAPLARLRSGGGMARRALIYLVGAMLTTVVAGLATAPFALFHFNRVAVYSLLANLGAVPLTSLWVMPWAVMAYAALPFGLDYLPLMAMAWGVDGVLVIAHVVAGLPGAAMNFPAMPTAALAAVVFGGLWLTLWRTRWRLGGLAGIVAGVALAATARPPDIIVAGDARSFAVRGDAGGLIFGGEGPDSYDREMWLRRSGLQTDSESGPSDPGPGRVLRCDAVACLYHRAGAVVSLIRNPTAAEEDCARADAVIALVPLQRIRCPAPVVVGRFDLWREGAHALWIAGPDSIRVKTVAGVRGRRPWVRIRHSGH